MSTTPADLPALQISRDQTERAKRIYAALRWGGLVAVTEMRDGYDAAMALVEEGPERLYPTDEEFANINTTALTAINYIEGR